MDPLVRLVRRAAAAALASHSPLTRLERPAPVIPITAVIVAMLLAVLMPVIAAAQVHSYAFIANFSDNSVSVIDSRTHAVVATINTGLSSPRGIAVTPDGRRALVIAGGSSLAVIDVATLTVTGSIALTGVTSPEIVVITPDGAKAYVTGLISGTVSVVDLVNNVWTSNISIPNPTSLAVTPNGNDLYVTSASPAQLTRIDTATDTVVGTPIALAQAARGIAITRDNAHAYVATTGSAIYEVDLATQLLTGSSFTTGAQPMAIAAAPDGRYLLVVNHDGATVAVFDLQARTVIATINIAGNSRSVAITPDSRWAYVSNHATDNVDVIDLDARMLSVPPIAVGDFPFNDGVDFISPAMLHSGTPLTISQDSDLADAGFRDYVVMRGGTLQLGANLTTSRTFSLLVDSTLNNNTHTAEIQDITGAGTLTKTGTGTLRLVGTASHGGTAFAFGTVAVNGTHTSAITATAGALIRGTGTIGSTVLWGGTTLRPGEGGPGILTVGTVQLKSKSKATFDINGPAAGTGYGRVAATDAVIEIGVTLDIQMDPSYVPPAGTQFTILTNVSSGTFSGRAEGAGFMVGAIPFRISYVGGVGGHDVVLTVDEAPTVTTLADDTVDEDHVYSVPFTIGDSLQAVGALSVTATTLSNQTLVPNVNLQVTGTGASRVLEVTPVANLSGTAQIRVTVSDGLLSTQRTFNLTVDAVDDPPTITAIGPQSIAEEVSLAPVAFTIDDIDTDVATLTVTATSSDQNLVEDAAIVIAGSGGSGVRTVALTPKADASGSATIAVRVSDGHDFAERQFLLTVNNVNDAPTITAIAPQTIVEGGAFAVSAFTVSDVDDDVATLVVTASSSNQALIPDANLTLGGSGGARTVTAAHVEGQLGSSTITVTVSDGEESASVMFVLTVAEEPAITYTLAEGATGSFFDTDLAIANPNAEAAAVTITFMKDDGTPVVEQRTLAPMSRTTIEVDALGGLDAAAFSMEVTSTTGAQLGVERTMRWGTTGYGASTEKASLGASNTWYFAEGSQGFFSTFLLLANPQAAANVARVTWLREGETPIVRDYELGPRSRLTVDAFTEPELRDRAFGATVTFDQPGFAERSMYFGANPVWVGGHAAAGATTLGTNWYLAEGATGSFFSTFVLIANPGIEPADITLTYYPESGAPVTRTDVLGPGLRMTRNIAIEDASLESAAVATRVTSTQPVIVERSQYWGSPSWTESHNSVGVSHASSRWVLAEGRVGGEEQAQTYILLANTGTEAATATLTFLRADGMTLSKDVNVPAESRVTVGVTGAADGMVPELTNEAFGTLIESTQPIIVERSLYWNANGMLWAAGTNTTAASIAK